MITVSTAIRDPQNNFAQIGAAGADVLIASVAAVLDSVNFLETGKLTLFQSTGQVVSDQEWPADANDLTPFFYTDLTSPAVPVAIFDQILAVEDNQLNTIKFDGHLAYVYHPPDFSGQYYLVIFVKESEIFAPVDDTLEDLNAASITISLTLAGIVVAVFAFLMGVVLYIIDHILKVFAEMSHNVDALLGNVGCAEKDLTDGMVAVSPVSTFELQNMQMGMNNLIATMRATRERNSTAATVENPSFLRMVELNSLVEFTASETPSAPSVTHIYDHGADSGAGSGALEIAKAIPVDREEM